MLGLCLTLLPIGGRSRATTPRIVKFSSVQNFLKGTLKNTSVRHPGRIQPGLDAARLMDSGDPYIWSCAMDREGHLYFGTGNDGRIYRISAGGDSSLFFDAMELEIYALIADPDGGVFAGTSPDGAVYKIAPDGRAELFFDPGERYIWDIKLDRRGRLYVAVGEPAAIYRVGPDGKSTIVLKDAQTHIRCMALDSSGQLYAGSSGDGYVYKMTGQDSAFVLFDTGMAEVHSIAVCNGGEIYAAAFGSTAQAFETARSSRAQTGGNGNEVTLSAQSILPGQAPPMPQVSTSLFRIDPDGHAIDLWIDRDEPVQTLIADSADAVLLGTGEQGRLYRVERTGEISQLWRTAESQITALLRTPKGGLVAGTSNMGRCYRLGPARAKSGSYISETVDTGALSSWGRLSHKGRGPVRLYTRSGNTKKPESSWSTWAQLAAEAQIPSPPARFIQWKCELSGAQARLSEVTLSYIQKNLPPRITAVIIHPPGDVYRVNNQDSGSRTSHRPGLTYPTPLNESEYKKGFRSVDWLFEDPNFDGLSFDLHCQNAAEGEWMTLASDLEQSVYSWDSEQMPDGEYRIKVVASDSPTNPVGSAHTAERRSDPFIIDNTGPRFDQIVTSGNGRIEFQVSDQWSRLKEVKMSINAGEWNTVFPRDGLCDSREESFSVALPPAQDGQVRIALRAFDDAGNSTAAHTKTEGEK